MTARKPLISIFLFTFFIFLTVEATAKTFDWETVSGYQIGGLNQEFGWNYSYDIGFFNNTILVDVDIKLVGDQAGTALLSTWEDGIENLWSTNKFSVPIAFNVDWVSADYDQLVTVVASDGRDNMVLWYSGNPAGWGYDYQDEVAAHEFGHMLSLFDEYPGGAVNPLTGLTGTGGLMATLAGTKETLMLDAYYSPFLSWYDHKVAGNANPVPEPTTCVLFGMGIAALVSARRKTKT